MTAAPPASLLDLLLGLGLATPGQGTSNRFALEGLTLASQGEGALEVGLQRFEATSLRLASGPMLLEVGRLALHEVVAQVRIEAGKPRLQGMTAARAELAGVKFDAPFTLPLPAQAGPSAPALAARAAAAGSGAWSLGPLAAADGTVRAEIVDAHLLFDANVTVPIRQGQVDFNQATVEHVGPDSRMGVSRMGLYVDAPNGRSYLYQFASAPVAGVQYERRSALPGPWGGDRGSLQLQPFGEALMREPLRGPTLGLTEQARLLFDRTAVSGEVQLGDGPFAAPGVHAEVVGRAEGRNVVRLRSPAVGRGLTLEMDSLSARNAGLRTGAMQLECSELAGALMIRFFLDNAQLRCALDVGTLKVAGLNLQLQRPTGA